MRRTAEFDAFGPWIFEVTSPEEVPPLYRSHRLDLESAELVLKVPRRIWRREANPDMDLYDHLLVAGPAALTVLTRKGDGYETVEVPYRRTAAIASSVSLLDGRFLVYDVEGSQANGVAINVRYNSVSHDLIERLVGVLRAKVREVSPAGPTSETPPHTEHGPLALRDLGEDDVALVTEQRELAHHDDQVVPAATHQRTTVQRRTGTMPKVLDMLRPVTLHAAIVCVSPGQLHVLHRQQWFSVGKRPVHSVAHTVIVIPQVTAVEVNDVKRYASARSVRVTSGRAVIELPFPSSAETGAAIVNALGTVPKR